MEKIEIFWWDLREDAQRKFSNWLLPDAVYEGNVPIVTILLQTNVITMYGQEKK